jgi:hypothetical protein
MRWSLARLKGNMKCWRCGEGGGGGRTKREHIMACTVKPACACLAQKQGRTRRSSEHRIVVKLVVVLVAVPIG